MKRTLIRLTLATLILSPFGAMADQGLSQSLQMQIVQAQPVRILEGSAFIHAKLLAPDDSYRYFLKLPADPNEDRAIFHGRAQYSLNINPDKLDRRYFQDIQNMQRLVGAQNSLNLMSQDPFVFQSSIGNTFMTITSVQTMAFYDGVSWARDPNLRTAILKLTDRADAPKAVIVQYSSQFNHYLANGFMITLLYANASGQTDVEVISALLINHLPPFVGGQPIRDNSLSNLISYANNLSRERL